ncbi:LAQU0S21e00804g1_1 [Lachancea quebecensis]|uniref:LAQU0S21e00804g1_1 n=1 Tax=Lachancea quebecensis TaxID=1654605 RepID=A0A0P1KXD4_9SACH|nr:LAQU0S21e00804g1_1 [Lachancea quebecensis]
MPFSRDWVDSQRTSPVPTRPGTVYLGKYSFSRDTLEETQNEEQITDFKTPPKSTRSFRTSIKRVFGKQPLQPAEQHQDLTKRHHKFRRWLNTPDKEFTCSWSDLEDGLTPKIVTTSGTPSPERNSEIETVSRTSGPGGFAYDTLRRERDDSSEVVFEMFSRMFLDSNSGATLHEDKLQNAPLKTASSAPCTRSKNRSGRRKHTILHKFRSTLRRSRPHEAAGQFSLTEKYMGSDENLQRCLDDMDLMPFDLTAPSTAGNSGEFRDTNTVAHGRRAGCTSEFSDIEQTHRRRNSADSYDSGFLPGALHVRKIRQCAAESSTHCQ